MRVRAPSSPLSASRCWRTICESQSHGASKSETGPCRLGLKSRIFEFRRRIICCGVKEGRSEREERRRTVRAGFLTRDSRICPELTTRRPSSIFSRLPLNQPDSGDESRRLGAKQERRRVSRSRDRDTTSGRIFVLASCSAGTVQRVGTGRLTPPARQERGGDL